MKTLLIHNKYLQSGGEDSVFEDEKSLLESNGHKVITYIRSNEETKEYSVKNKAEFFLNTVYSLDSYNQIDRILKEQKPDIVHVHNFFPLISPSVFVSCFYNKVPVVQTLHNFRLMCANAMFLRQGKPCELCLEKKNPFLGVKYGCYRNSKLLTLDAAAMIFWNQRNFKYRVDSYIALTDFNRKKFIQAGIPEDRIKVKPNFVRHDIKPGKKEDFAIYVGRLAMEKGIATLAKAWQLEQPLEVYGGGDYGEVFQSSSNASLKGTKPMEECIRRMSKARFLVLPTEWYEAFPRTIIEAFSVGTPVLASDIGNMPHIIKDGKTGILFKAGDANDLKKKAEWMFSHKKECEEMGKNAYKEYLDKYTPEKNYKMLMDIYEEAMKNAKAR